MSKVSAIFICLEVAIMGASQIFPSLPPILATAMFWGGLLGVIITIGLWLLEKIKPRSTTKIKNEKIVNNKIFENILDIVAKYNQITADYVYNPHYPKAKTQENQNNLEKDFNILLALKEVMLDNKLERYLKDIRQRIAIIFNYAMSLEFDENELRKKRMHGAISNHEYNQEMPELHNDFLKHKEIIIKYLKQ